MRRPRVRFTLAQMMIAVANAGLALAAAAAWASLSRGDRGFLILLLIPAVWAMAVWPSYLLAGWLIGRLSAAAPALRRGRG